MTEVAAAYVSIVPSLKGFKGKLESQISAPMDGAGKASGKRFGGSFSSSFKSSLKGFGAGIVAGMGAAAVTGFFKDAISGASDLNESSTKIQAIFGGASGAVQDFAKHGAKALGQTKLQVLDAAASFGTFGKAAGLQGPELAKFSTGLSGLSTDLASFFNTSPEQAAEAISAGLRGEAEPLRQYGVLLDDASLRQEALKQGLIKTTKEALTPQQKVLAAQALIYKQTKDAQGDFARTSGGLANQQRILSAQFSDFKTTIGTALLPVITKMVTFINGSMIPAFKTIAGFIKRNADVIGPLAAGLLAAGGAFALLSGVAKAYTAVQAALNFVLAANPVGIVVVALAGLVAGLVVAYKRSEKFRAVVNGAFKAVADAGKFLWERVLKPVFRFIVDAWVTVAGAIIHGAAAAFGWVPGLGPKLKAAAGKFDEFRDSVNRALDGTHSKKSIQILTPGAREANRQLADLLYKTQHLPKSVTIGVSNKLNNIPGRLRGGPVSAGQPYIVGERQPELFVPNVAGRIVPSVPTASSSQYAPRMHPADLQALLEVARRPILMDGRVVANSVGSHMLPR